jgi:ribosomal protein S18 acetylase RimI-like enzyme
MNKDISRVIEANLHEFYFRIAVICGLKYNREAIPAYIRSYTRRWPDFILGGTKQAEQEDFIEEINLRIQTGKYPPLWIIREPAEPDIFLDLARKFNIMPVNRWTGMCLSKDDFIDDPVNLPGLDIQKLKKDEIDNWTALINKEVFRRDALTTDMVALMIRDTSFHMFRGLNKGRIVSTVLIFMDRQTAGVYLVSTDSGFRRQGIGKAMMLHAVKDCFAGEIDQVILHATRDGENIYKKMGFREYCYFDILYKYL